MRKAEIRNHNGVPTVFIDDQPCDFINYRCSHLDFAWEKVPEDMPAFLDKVARGVTPDFHRTEAMTAHEQRIHGDMGKQGIHFHMIPTVVGHKRLRWDQDGWTAPDRFCYDTMDACIAKIIEADPKAYIMPLAFLGTPRWWAKANPDELVVAKREDGTTFTFLTEGHPEEFHADYSSPIWREDLGKALRNYLRHIKKSAYADRIVGFHIASAAFSNEWFTPFPKGSVLSFSKRAIKSFQEFLAEKYETIEKLNSVWKTNHKNFARIEPPTLQERDKTDGNGLRSPSAHAHSIDYNIHYAKNTADCIAHFSRIIKEETENKSLVCTFHGYITLLGREEAHDFGMFAIDQVYRNPDVDIITAPDAYGRRKPGTGYPHYMNLTESVALHNKVWLAQNDYRTVLNADTGLTREYHGRCETLAEDLNQIRYVFMNDLTRSAPTQFHDQGYNRYDSPDHLKALGECQKVFRKSLGTDRRRVDEVAFIVDPIAPFYYGRKNNITRTLINALGYSLSRTGAPFGYYSLDDWDKIPPHKFYVFPNALFLSEGKIASLITRFAKEKVTVLWNHACGSLHAHEISPKHMKKLTGFDVEWEKNQTSKLIELMTGEKIPFHEGKSDGPLFYLPDQNSISVLGKHADGRAAVASKDMGGWTSVYSAAPLLSTDLLRTLSLKAGVHCYTDKEIAVFANRSFLGIMSPKAGNVQVQLPDETPLVDVFSGEVVSKGGKKAEIKFTLNEAKIFYRGTLEQWKKLDSFQSFEIK